MFSLVLFLQVHLMVAVVGRLFQKWFPAQPNLSYTFIWDKTDAYGQRVYGLSEAVGESEHAKQKITDLMKHALNKQQPWQRALERNTWSLLSPLPHLLIMSNSAYIVFTLQNLNFSRSTTLCQP